MTIFAVDTRLQRRDDLLAADISPTETVVLDVTGGSYYGMRNVSKAIWDHLRSPLTVDGLCERLLTEFEVDEETCRRETTAFLEKLHERGLIVARPPGQDGRA